MPLDMGLLFLMAALHDFFKEGSKHVCFIWHYDDGLMSALYLSLILLWLHYFFLDQLVTSHGSILCMGFGIFNNLLGGGTKSVGKNKNALKTPLPQDAKIEIYFEAK